MTVELVECCWRCVELGGTRWRLCTWPALRCEGCDACAWECQCDE